MLHTEEEIVGHGDEGKNDLSQIQPIFNRQASACERRDSSDKIQQNIENGPPFGTLPLVVPISRRRVLDQRYGQLSISQHSHRIPIIIPLDPSELNDVISTK